MNVVNTPDVFYGHKDGLALTYDVFTPGDANRAGLLFMFSGGWVSTWMPPDQTFNYIRPLLEQGFIVFAVRHGSSPKYLIPEIAGEVRRSLQHIIENLADYHVDADRSGVFGFSAGGHLSLLLGTQTNHEGQAGSAPRVRAVVAVSPPTDLAPYVEPGNPLCEQFPSLKFDPGESDLYSPPMHVTADDAATLLVHGDKDELVPIRHNQKIAA
ncbi:MAG: alpha/beta hydrolase, partial [Gammaproteobacteria bacterium]